MSEPRVIKADYANWRPVSGRKVLQLVFEVPMEQTEQVMQMLGVPMPGESKWCAIALLNSEIGDDEKPISPVAQRSEPAAHNGSVAGSNPAGTTKQRKSFDSLPLVQQCAIRCGDAQFAMFLMDTRPETASKYYEAAGVVRDLCKVDSRKELATDELAASIWNGIEIDFQDWLTEKRYADIYR